MRRRAALSTGLCLAVTAVLLLTMTGMSAADGVLQGTPLGDALEKVEELGSKITGILMPNTKPVAEAGVEGSGYGGTSTGLPVLDPGGALDPSAIPGADSLRDTPDTSRVSGPDSLTEALDPSRIPGLDSLPGAGGSAGGALPPLPGMDGLPGINEFDPMGLLQILDSEDGLFVVIDLASLIEVRLGLGKDLEKASLLDLSVILFDALAAEGSLGVTKIDDNAFLMPLEIFLKYMAGDDGWKEILELVVRLELSFPGAGAVPDGFQAVIDALYKYLLRPILSLLPVYRYVEPEQPAPEPALPEVPAAGPPVDVGGEVTGKAPGGTGDHLPFTGADLSLLLTIIVALAVSGLLLRRLERKMRRKGR